MTPPKGGNKTIFDILGKFDKLTDKKKFNVNKNVDIEEELE